MLDNPRYRQDIEGTDVDAGVARFHHRLVLIHAFDYGNGMHEHLTADALLPERRQPPFPWGLVSLVDAGEVRERHVGALRAADRDNIQSYSH